MRVFGDIMRYSREEIKIKVKEMIEILKKFNLEDEIYLYDEEFIIYHLLSKIYKSDKIVIKRNKHGQDAEIVSGIALEYDD